MTRGLLIIGPPELQFDDIRTMSFTTLPSAQIAEWRGVVKDIVLVVFMSSRPTNAGPSRPGPMDDCPGSEGSVDGNKGSLSDSGQSRADTATLAVAVPPQSD